MMIASSPPGHAPGRGQQVEDGDPHEGRAVADPVEGRVVEGAEPGDLPVGPGHRAVQGVHDPAHQIQQPAQPHPTRRRRPPPKRPRAGCPTVVIAFGPDARPDQAVDHRPGHGVEHPLHRLGDELHLARVPRGSTGREPAARPPKTAANYNRGERVRGSRRRDGRRWHGSRRWRRYVGTRYEQIGVGGRADAQASAIAPRLTSSAPTRTVGWPRAGSAGHAWSPEARPAPHRGRASREVRSAAMSAVGRSRSKCSRSKCAREDARVHGHRLEPTRDGQQDHGGARRIVALAVGDLEPDAR